MATATSAFGKGRITAFDSVAASQTDSNLVTAVSNRRIRVHALIINQGDTTASAVTFNSKGSGAGTAITPALKTSANGSFVVTENTGGWFQTNIGEGLTVTTGAGSTTGIIVSYSIV